MIMAAVEVNSHPECLLIAVSMEALTRQFRQLQMHARRDGFHASLQILENTFQEGLDNSAQVL